MTVDDDFHWDYKDTHLTAYLDKIDEIGDQVRT